MSIEKNAGTQQSKVHLTPSVGQNLFFQPKLEVGPTDDVYEREADAVAEQVISGSSASVQRKISTVDVQRKCPACEEEKLQRKCAKCEEEEKLQRKEIGNSPGGNSAPSIVHDALTSPGKAIDTETRSFMEGRFGYDFSNVKIHTDAIATKSAQSINAHAYTSGNDIVFNESKYSPETTEGKKLLAHELTHVVQQTGTIQRDEKLPCFDEVQISEDMKACPEENKDVGRQPPSKENTVDAKAQAIIDAAKDTSTAMSNRAIAVVRDIICTYMPSSASKVQKIIYYPKEEGLFTQSVGSGKSTLGKICVGDYFVEHIDSFARRVLQVAHELQHIDQYRSGMGGYNRRNEREFLAHYNGSLDDEFIGTGRMNAGTRKNLIDGALKYYYCMTDTARKEHSSKLQDLLTRRETVNKDKPSDPPKDECPKGKKDEEIK